MTAAVRPEQHGGKGESHNAERLQARTARISVLCMPIGRRLGSPSNVAARSSRGCLGTSKPLRASRWDRQFAPERAYAFDEFILDASAGERSPAEGPVSSILAVGNEPGMKREISAAAVARGQGIFNVIGGLWPIIGLRSFEYVYGRKHDIFLQKTVGGLLVSIGCVQLTTGNSSEQLDVARRSPPPSRCC